MTQISAAWVKDERLQALLVALGEGDDEARVVGGAVRNTLMDRPVTDIDIATTTRPEETIRRAEAIGLKTVPTGIAHGTVTVVSDGRPYEVTTLRRDIETDGRHAVVTFGRDWQADAERRDFTINALYADREGRVLDLVGGLADLERGMLRFIGDAEQRILEDRLRILRFFRFFAWYGRGRPDADGLRAATRLKDGLTKLSAERVWNEMRKLLAAPDPSRALLWMRQTGALTVALPESERWGIDDIHALVETERVRGWAPDALLRLMAIVPPDPARLSALSQRLKLANHERDRLLAFANEPEPDPDESDRMLKARLFLGNRQASEDRLRLALAKAQGKVAGDPAALETVAKLTARLATVNTFTAPSFPLKGEDLLAKGFRSGPVLGKEIDRLKQIWVKSGFTLGREDLLAASTSPETQGD
ncbi:CCA tRNA nucleotidyltransferase [Jiella sp. MQZ9-1]|uniref:CCA tRNA nucleotidyltransferase n=1 Tax=Jiella flava TaxID=2816857 RepID=A0A939JUK8_9HYPH|nr:CCA tRNA nucleotidyltransferase [Jiella flava]MBO0663290.1 CCA tRNA nucleotidyltransferase [Jiella flava]MCD2471866.1 CCA tRNA nucleotidyltransferase [Jiella flava]